MNSSEDIKKINEVLAHLFGIREINGIERMGGMTNRTYCVTADQRYVVRLPGEGTEQIINRYNEKISTELANKTGIDAKLYYFDPRSGIKVSEYIEDSQTMHFKDLQKTVNIVLVAETLRKLHCSGIDTKVPFDVINMAETYEHFILQNNGSFYDDYTDIKKYIDRVKTEYLPAVKKAPCHNDPLCENWILQHNCRIYLVDWEYAGMNDPMWDLADVALEAGLDSTQETLLLKAYLGTDASEEDWNSFQMNKVLIDYLWSLWGKARAVYEGEEMEQYALNRYIRMKENMIQI